MVAVARPTHAEVCQVIERCEVVRLRVEVNEKKGFEKAARLAGLSFSAWARERLRRAATKEFEEVSLENPFIERRD